MKNSTVLILGVGYLGSSLACLLAQKNYKVLGTYGHTCPELKEGIQLEQVDITAGIQDKEHWGEAKTWICLLPPSCSARYVEGLRQWIQLAEQLGAEHLIYSSSISVFSELEGILDEDAIVSPTTEGAKKIVEVENLILESQIPHKTVLRLGGLFDRDRHPIYRLVQRPFIDHGQQVVNMVHRQDAVEALAYAVFNRDGVRIRHIVHPLHPTREQFYQQQAKQLKIHLPPFTYGNITGKIVTTRHNDFPIPSLGIDVC